MTIGTRIFTWLRGEHVGADQFGNQYYQDRKPVKGQRRKRWVMYNGEVEASRVPPDWHGWLHHTVDTPPPAAGLPRREWQKDHVPNLTGTAEAYRPPGHVLSGGRRDKATGDYEPWKPN